MNFPHERARLHKLIGATKAGGILILSGDRHLAEQVETLIALRALARYETRSSSVARPGI